MGDVATKKLYENDKVIVWDLTLEPGERTGVHTHKLDYMLHVLEGSTLRAYDGDGTVMADVPLEDETTLYFAVKDGIATANGLQTNATHEAENVGTGRYREIMVEVK